QGAVLLKDVRPRENCHPNFSPLTGENKRGGWIERRLRRSTMTVRLNLRRLPLTTTLAVALAIAAAVEAQQLPNSVAIGSNPLGSLFYSLASGIAKIISQSTP